MYKTLRIHSKFSDYYDSALGYGIDEACHYVRKTEKFEPKSAGVAHPLDPLMEKEFYTNLIYRAPRLEGWSNNDRDFSAYIFMFCGKIYVGLKVKTKIKDINSEYVWAWSYDDVAKIIEEHGTKREKRLWNSKKHDKEDRWRYFRYKFTNKRHMEELFSFNGIERNDAIDFHHDTGIPVMLIITEDKGKGARLIYNPVLADHEFYKVLDAYQAFQEISMFISGVLGGNSPKMVEISNKDKIHKHGFDKFSFRKEKENGKS